MKQRNSFILTEIVIVSRNSKSVTEIFEQVNAHKILLNNKLSLRRNGNLLLSNLLSGSYSVMFRDNHLFNCSRDNH